MKKKKSSDIHVCSMRGFPSILSSIYRLCIDISAILVDFFRFFLHPTIVCQYHAEMARHPKCRRYITTFPTLVITNNKTELPFIISFFLRDPFIISFSITNNKTELPFNFFFFFKSDMAP